jgi:hypothetical protein
VLVIEEVLDVAARAGEKIIDADNDSLIRQQALAEMRAEKAGATGDQHAFFQMHGL